MQFVIWLASQVQKTVAMWHPDICFMCKAQIVGVELLGEMYEFTIVSRIKQHNVLLIQSDRPHVFVFIEEVLHHEDH